MADPGRLDELKRKFEENSKRYFAPLANEYRKAGEPERAIELCRTYLPQQPTHMSGYIVYGQALHDTGQTEESAAVFRQALTLDPENIIALRHLGDIARDAGDRVGAMRWYGKVLELDPRNEEIAAYITSLAQPGTKAFAPPAATERPAPPTIRPEPEPDESAVRLEDIVSQPDMAQPRIGTEIAGAATGGQSHPPEFAPLPPETPPEPAFVPEPELDDVQDVGADIGAIDADDATVPEFGEPDEPFEPFGVADWPTARDIAAATADDAADSDTVLEGPWHSPADAEALAEPDSTAGDSVATAAAAAAAGEDSPFVTETMAELYLTQGLHSEALDIYRKLARRRDNDPALKQRIAEIEAAQTAQVSRADAARGTAGETVRGFFARIGALRSGDRVRLAADHDSSLGAFFGSVTPDANDVSAAQRLAGAFGNPRHGNQGA